MSKNLLEAVEASSFRCFSTIPGWFEINYNEEYALLVTEKVDYYELNRAGMIRTTEAKAEEIIREVTKIFKEKNKTSFGWIVGPLTQPKNFAKQLQKFNYQLQGTIWGMSKQVTEKIEGLSNSDYLIKSVSLEELKDNKIMKNYERAYGLPEGTEKKSYPFYKALEERGIKWERLIAYDGEKPIAFGGIIQVPGTNVGFLMGGATLAEYRKKGLYGTILKRRLEIAKKWGMTDVIVHGKEKTSAPIIAKHGFKKISESYYYIWKGKVSSK